jgi:hypothetical protein
MLRPHELFMAEQLEEMQDKAGKAKGHIREKGVTEHTLMMIISDMRDRLDKLESAYAVRQAIIKTR